MRRGDSGGSQKVFLEGTSERTRENRRFSQVPFGSSLKSETGGRILTELQPHVAIQRLQTCVSALLHHRAVACSAARTAEHRCLGADAAAEAVCPIPVVFKASPPRKALDDVVHRARTQSASVDHLPAIPPANRTENRARRDLTAVQIPAQCKNRQLSGSAPQDMPTLRRAPPFWSVLLRP